MKRFGNLYHKIIDIENIKEAHLNARKNKTHYREVEMVDANIDFYSHQVRLMLDSETYKVSPYKTFKKKDKGKMRTLYKLPYFPDRIVQHAIMQVLEPIWKSTLITDTYQAIKGRSAFKCLKKVKRDIQTNGCNYCLQIDINKFYPSIDNSILKSTIRNKIKCKKTLLLLDNIVDSCNGVPIGNYISQYFGNILLSKLDHKMKEVVKAKNYYRYCDDIVVLSQSKDFLVMCKAEIENELRKLNLTIKGNWQIYRITKDRGVDFLGVVTYKTNTKIRKRIVKSFKAAAKSCDTRKAVSIICYFGWVKHTYSFNLWRKCAGLYLHSLYCKYGGKIASIKEIKILVRLTNGIQNSNKLGRA